MNSFRRGFVLLASLVAVTAERSWADGAGVLGEIQRAASTRKVKLADVIETAMKSLPGSMFLEGGMAWRPHPAVFEVDVLDQEIAKTVFVDCATGKVLLTEPLEIDEEEQEEIVEAKQASGHAKIGIDQAIRAAEKSTSGGSATWVMIEIKHGRPVYTVFVLTADKILSVGIDAADGKIVSSEDRRIAAGYWGFNTASAGAAPSGWSFRETHAGSSIGRWRIVSDPTSPSTPNVMNLTTHNKGRTFSLALVEKISFKDLELEVFIKSNTGKEDQGGGLVWRCKDENNYYICRINPLENNFRLYKVINGDRQQLDTFDLDLSAGKWYRMRVTMEGDRIVCYLNGKKRLEARDDSIKTAGMIGLWTKADASSSFDDVVVFSSVEKLER